MTLADRALDPRPSTLARLPLSLALRVNEACERFERDWKSGRRPRIEEDLLALPEPDRPLALRELIALEVELRRGAGDAPDPGAYRDRFPAEEAAVAEAFAEATDASSAGDPDRADVPGGSATTRSWPRSPEAGWASSTGPGRSAPTGSWP